MLVYRAYGSERIRGFRGDQGGHRECGGAHDDEDDECASFPEASDGGDEHGALREEHGAPAGGSGVNGGRGGAEELAQLG